MTLADERTKAALEARARRLGLPAWQLEMAEAVSGDVMADIRRDNQRSREPSSIIPSSPKEGQGPAAPINRSGWVEPAQVDNWKPPGQAYLDRMLDHQDAVDGAELAAKLARAKRG